MMRDWFETLFGFREGGEAEVRRQLDVEGTRLVSRQNGRSFAIGTLELLPLRTLRERAAAGPPLPGRLRVQSIQGDVRALHRVPVYTGALFQVASQFNLLEMVGPSHTPEQGVTRYAGDPTQGPACAIAAGAATVYRNYFVLVGAHIGQTSGHQLDGLADLGARLAVALDQPASSLWSMENGYALCSATGLAAITRYLTAQGPDVHDTLRDALRVGVHWDVEVTDQTDSPGPLVSQIFCSALPVAYSGIPASQWHAFASLILDAAYEATLFAGVINAQRGGSNIVLLTRLGGGAFGNDNRWIDASIRRALDRFVDVGLDVRMVSYGAPAKSVLNMVSAFSDQA